MYSSQLTVLENGCEEGVDLRGDFLAVRVDGLFGKKPLAFVGYALLSLVLWFLVVVAIVIFGCATCCCGFLILAIPYLGTVAMLPVFYAYRAWSLGFLAQFGPDWTLWPAPPPVPEPPPTPEPPPPPAFDPGI